MAVSTETRACTGVATIVGITIGTGTGTGATGGPSIGSVEILKPSGCTTCITK